MWRGPACGGPTAAPSSTHPSTRSFATRESAADWILGSPLSWDKGLTIRAALQPRKRSHKHTAAHPLPVSPCLPSTRQRPHLPSCPRPSHRTHTPALFLLYSSRYTYTHTRTRQCSVLPQEEQAALLGLFQDHMVAVLAMRTAEIDEHVMAAVGGGSSSGGGGANGSSSGSGANGSSRGVRQLVILGAGLDMRAWRLPLEVAGPGSSSDSGSGSSSGVTVFELDSGRNGGNAGLH